MLNLGTIRPGRTIDIPFESFASSTGAPITASNFAVGDVKVFKDASMTERASTSGFTLIDTDGIDLDGITGIHGVSLDLSDNTTAGFWAAGSRYLVAISTITVDSQTMSFWAARFTIGYDAAVLNTTIATLSTQTSFTLTAGPAEDDALNGAALIFHDVASAVQMAFAIVGDYTGSTKTVTLVTAPTFTIATSDNVCVFPPSLQPTVWGRTLDVSSGGESGVDWANVGSPTTTVNLSGTTVKTATDVETDTQDIQSRLPAALVSGRIDASVGAMAANTLTATAIAADAITAAKIADGAIDAATFAAGAIDATAIADGAIDAATLASGTITSAKFAAGAIDATAIAADAIGSSELATSAVNEIAAAILATPANLLATDSSGRVTVGSLANGAITAAAIATDAIDADALAADAIAEINATVDTALADINLDHLVKIAVDTDFPTTVHLNSVLGQMADDGTSATFDRTTDSLEALANSGGGGPTAADIADAVWDETLADHLTSGSTGAGLNAAGSAGDPWNTALPGSYGSGTAGKIVGDNLNATVGSRATQVSVDDIPTNAELATALAAADDAVLAAIAALNNLSQANVRTAMGLASANLDTQLDAIPTNSDLATALASADDAVLAAIAALNNLSQANVRTAIGLASANLDTQLGTLQTGVTSLLASVPEGLQAETAYDALPFHLVQDTDHDAPATGISVTAEIKLDTGSYAAMDNAVVEKSDGDYYVPISNTDITAGTEFVTFRFSGTGAATLEFSVKVST